jgi:hypothetical protein
MHPAVPTLQAKAARKWRLLDLLKPHQQQQQQLPKSAAGALPLFAPLHAIPTGTRNILTSTMHDLLQQHNHYQQQSQQQQQQQQQQQWRLQVSPGCGYASLWPLYETLPWENLEGCNRGSYHGPGKQVMAHTERLAERLALPRSSSPNR